MATPVAASVSFAAPRGCSACSRALSAVPTAETAPSAIPESLAPGPVQAFAEQMRAKGMPVPTWYVLSARARMALEPLFSSFRLDLNTLVISTGGAFGNAGITFGRTILLQKSFGTGPTARLQGQLRLLAHEMTHSVQYARIGLPRFIVRYLGEWRKSGGNPYGVPAALAAIPLASLDPIDGRFYLDQISDRVAAELRG